MRQDISENKYKTTAQLEPTENKWVLIEKKT